MNRHFPCMTTSGKSLWRAASRSEFAFIHEANTEVRKKELFAKVRSGQVRVLMGSTFKMGAGMNVQDRLVALHDLDAPWRPGDLEQRSDESFARGIKTRRCIFTAMSQRAHLTLPLANRRKQAEIYLTDHDQQKSGQKLRISTKRHCPSPRSETLCRRPAHPGKDGSGH